MEKSKNNDYQLLIFGSAACILSISFSEFSFLYAMGSTLFILILLASLTKNNNILIIAIAVMGYHFFKTENYYTVFYPVIVYLCLYFHYAIYVLILLAISTKELYLKTFSFENYIILGVLFLILIVNYKKNKQESPKTYQLIIDDFNQELLEFCSFLDFFTTNPKDNENNKIYNACFNLLIDNYCRGCQKKGKCFGEKKLDTYRYLKDLITFGEYIFNQPERKNLSFCIHNQNMSVSAQNLQKKYGLITSSNHSYEINNLSSVIRQYFIEMNNGKDQDLEYLINLKDYLIDYGIPVKIFEPKIMPDKKFKIKLGIDKRKNATTLIKDIFDKAQKYFNNIKLSIKNVTPDDSLYEYFLITHYISFRAIAEHASLAKNNLAISGDNYFVSTYDDGRFICALADGMGSGYEAYKLSKETLELVEKLGKCNLHSSTSINILNTFYSLKENHESFSTLDLFELDLTTGRALLYKMGATTTFIISQEDVKTIYNENLPCGINDLIITDELLLEDNDLVIMISDGISEYINENILRDFLYSIKGETPHRIVYEILQRIYYENNYSINDDMSVIAIRINKI